MKIEKMLVLEAGGGGVILYGMIRYAVSGTSTEEATSSSRNSFPSTDIAILEGTYACQYNMFNALAKF